MAPSNRTAKSKKSPAFQAYPSDFINDEIVEDMSLTEVGAYWLLLCREWLGNGLPNDLDWMARRLKLSPARFRRMWDASLSKCFVLRDGKFYNKRLDYERAKQRDFRRRNSDNGKLGGRPPKEPKINPEWNPEKTDRFVRENPARRDETEKERVFQVSENVDVAFRAFQSAYPAARRKGGFLSERAFFDSVCAAGGPQPIMDALANHVASEQWQNPQLIPGMDVWLREERWRQVLPAAGESDAIDKRTPAWAR